MTISDVQCKNGQYYVYDEDGREVKTFWDSEGELAGFGQDFLVFERNGQYRFVKAESGDEIASVWRDSVGRFKHANADLVVFERNDQVFTHKVGCSGVSEISSRWV